MTVRDARRRTAGEYDAVVIGAGFAGLYMLYRLRGLGLRTIVFEAGSGIGGTWFWNRYPGSRCDIESLQYSYSFDEDLQQEWEWTERYATQPELLRYLEHVAERFDLLRDILLERRVESANWQEDTRLWRVRTDAGDDIEARFCISAAGCLSVPRIPDLAGMRDFTGRTLITATWPDEHIDFTGQRVGVIGTGSSGIQVVPQLASQADEVIVFQRSPNFSLPAMNRPLDADVQADYKARYPEMRQRARRSRFGITSDITPAPSALDEAPEERERVFENAWEYGGNALPGAYVDVALDLAANKLCADFVRSKIRAKVDDPVTAEKLSPRDHPIFGRRPCIDINYYETFNQPHVTLVDLRETPIERVVPDGVRTSARLIPLDVIVFATGFDAVTGALLKMDIRGIGGETLRDKWSEGPRSYLGVGHAGFPNLLTITGPGSPSVISNVVVSIEQHVEWITELISHMEAAGHHTVDAEPDAEKRWVEHVNEVADATVMGKTPSWFMGANVPGKPKVFMPYVGGVGTYRRRCDQVAERGYEGFRFG